jgi:hypothetical protein
MSAKRLGILVYALTTLALGIEIGLVYASLTYVAYMGVQWLRSE